MANRNPGRKRRLTPLGKLAVVFVCALLLLGGCFAVRGVLQSLYPQRYDDFVETYTAEHGLEKSFVYAVIKCESGFDPQAVSPVGARGLMQIMP
ncbi:MAG: transglycosylase SLT domain-containing protein, partial [Clostridia bacterium]|nr:transglycosylase SLT domain-containing protein [Clostridia bacterium]